MSNNKTLSSFVNTVQVELDGKNDYKIVDDEALRYFGHRLPNKQVWKCINHLQKQGAAVEVEDDL